MAMHKVLEGIMKEAFDQHIDSVQKTKVKQDGVHRIGLGTKVMYAELEGANQMFYVTAFIDISPKHPDPRLEMEVNAFDEGPKAVLPSDPYDDIPW